MKEVILKTAGMFDEYDPQDKDYELWKSISEYMDGEAALVMESAAKDGKYVFLGLTDREKDKELFYMIEQDSMIGRYIGARELFEAEWEKGDYEPEGCIYLEKKCLEFQEN